jgi:hypothetical protein
MVPLFGHAERLVNPYSVETCSVFRVMSCAMEKVATRLKNFRKSAVPRLTVRAMAEALDMPLGSYARYESVHDYKKPYFPIDFTRKVASVLADYRVDPAEVMTLAGLKGDETEPEARDIEATRPTVQYVAMQVALPSEVALRDMFRSLLVLVPEGASKDEAAEILARRLPAGLAAIGPLSLDQASVASLGGGAVAPPLATDRPESRP